MKKTSNYHHGNLKEELLNLALNIIQTQGIDAVTLQVLGNKLGTSRTAIYRHFSSKQDLLQNVIFFGFEKFEEKLSPIFQMKEKTVVERLYLVGIEYINFAIANPNLYRILFGEKFQEVRESNCDISEEENSEGFHALMKLLIEGQEAKLFNISNPMTQAQVIFSLCHGMASLYIDGHMNIKDNIKELYEVSFKTIINGLLVK